MNKLTVFLTLLAVNSAFGAPKQTSQSVLQKHMNSPVTNEVYRQVQIEGLSTIIDYRLYKLLTLEDPIISQVTPELVQLLKKQIQTSVVNELTQKSLVSTDSNQEIHKMVSEVMARLGFSELQIKNTRVYIAYGPANAYTYGADKDNIVIVINDKLLEKASKGEIMGVIGHELGHVLKQHVLQSVQLNLMLNRIATIALESHPLDKGDMSIGYDSRIDDILVDVEAMRIEHSYKTSGLQISHTDARTTATSQMEQTRQARKNLTKKLSVLYATTDPRIIVSSAQYFLLEMVRAMNTVEVPQETKEFFLKMARDLSTSYKPNVEDLFTHIRILVGAISREQETSSDLFGASIVDPFSSVKFDLKVAGGVGLSESPTREDVRKAVANLEKQLNEVKTTTDKNDLAINLSGSGESHPRHNIRAVNQVNLSQHFQIVALRNPFLRLVVLNDKLSFLTDYFDANVVELFRQKAMLEKLLKGPVLERTKVEKSLAQTQVVLQSNSNSLGTFKEPADELLKDIIELVTDLGFEKQNPRLNDLIDYEINLREFREALIGYYDYILPNVTNAEQLKSLKQQRMAVISSIKTPSRLLQELQKLAPKGSVAATRLDLLKASTDLSALLKLRAEIRKETKSENRLRADSSVSLNWRKSSSLKTKECVMALDALK